MKEIINSILDNIFEKYCIKCELNTKCYGYEKPEYCWFCKKSNMKNQLIEIKNVLATNNNIIEFIKIHGNKYCYDLFNYHNNRTKSTIICSIHGNFEQSSKCHLKGYNCMECSKKIKNIKNMLFNKKCKTIDELVTAQITLGKENHSNKYNYSLVKFIYNVWPIVSIICPIHGIFIQDIYRHNNNKNGCKKCSVITTSKKLILTKEDILTRCSKIFSNYYNYDNLIVPKNTNYKIVITCPVHGKFEQKLDSHLKGYGCYKCSHCYHMTDIEFSDKINKQHDNNIDLSIAKFINMSNLITVKCKLHNKIFSITTLYLLNGSSKCPKCKIHGASKLSNNIIEYLTNYYKIYIQYYNNQGEYKIPNTKFKADGFIRETNTIIEIHGSYYHGDLRMYSPNYYNTRVCMTMQELYNKTLKRSNIIREKGYNLIEFWEYDWLRYIKSIKYIQRKWRKYILCKPKITIDLPKKKFRFNCEDCKYHTNKGSNYTRHMETNSHKLTIKLKLHFSKT